MAGVWLQTSVSASKAGGAQTAPVVSPPFEPVLRAQSPERKAWGPWRGGGGQRTEGLAGSLEQPLGRYWPGLPLA